MFTSVLLSTFAVALISTLVGAEPEPVDRRCEVTSSQAIADLITPFQLM